MISITPITFRKRRHPTEGVSPSAFLVVPYSAGTVVRLIRTCLSHDDAPLQRKDSLDPQRR
jgi:hypothetical protein